MGQRESNQRYYAKNKELEKARTKAYMKANPDKVKVWNKTRYAKHKENIKKRVTNYVKENSDKVKAYQKAYREKNKVANAAYQKVYRLKNKIKLNEKALKRVKSKPENHIARNMRSYLSKYLKKGLKGKFRHLNYTPLELKIHLEKQFKEEMTWKNYGKYWHIDHRIPLKYKENGIFYWNQEDLTNKASLDFKEAWSLNNLKPMKASDNLKKSNKYKE